MLREWTDPPRMDCVAPQPVVASSGTDCWVSYRTNRHAHFAVLRFTSVQAYTYCERDDTRLPGGPAAGAGLNPRTWYRLDEPGLASQRLARWIATFPEAMYDVTARQAVVIVRAIEARDSASALAMVRA